MNAGADQAPQTNGGDGAQHQHHSANGDSDLSQILEALQAIYAKDSTNDTRRQATEYLEQAKRHPEAPSHGHTLALDRSQPVPLRYYGLTMLEYSMKYSWEDLTMDQRTVLRGYAIDLAQNVSESEPVFIRNKIAQLWTEVAKRSWGAEWLDMDRLLVSLWSTSLHHQAVVLYILETLSEEVFNREDATAGLRGSDLGRACVEIFTPLSVIQEQLPTREKSLEVRCGDEGWLRRLCDNLGWCLGQDYQNQEAVKANAIKTMHALKAAMPWIMPKAIAATQVIEAVCKALATPAVEMQIAAVETLQAIYNRTHLHDDEFVELVCPMFTPGSVSLLREVYNWTLTDMDVNDIDDQKYMLCKRLSELANSLGLFIEQKPQSIPDGSDLAGIFGFLYDIMRNPSLVVSIPVLHCWTKLLRSSIVRDSDVVNSMVGGLLETCCARLIRYESLPEDTEDVTLQFLNEDIDTIPERHAFLGNYRRFCADVIEVLVRKTPVEAMEHILAQATNMLQNLYNGQPTFQRQTFTKNSPQVLQVDAQVTVIEAALKGYMKWQQGQGEDAQDNERTRNTLEDSLEQWGRQILQAQFEDPEVARKIISLMATLSTKALGDRPGFALTFLEYMLTIRLADDTSYPQYSDSVKDLERICSLEMQKLAMKFADDFMNVYEQLEAKVNEMINDPTTDERQRMAYSAFLFIIIHRCTTLERATQEERMRQMLNSVKDAWRNDEFTNAISSFQSFCGVLGMGQLPEFLSANNFRGVQDWSDQQLPSDGQALQASILERSQHLPLRLTKTLLAASTEKLRDGTAAYETAAVLWAETIPVLLPNLLQLVSHAQAFNDIESNWSHLPVELQQVIRRVLTDRFWQAGISTESRDDFFARVSGSKSTYEGFASTVRGTVRQIRGEPRNAVLPDVYAESFSAAVDYLGLQDYIDRERIGAIGICGSGSFVLSAAKIDPRIKAIATASMYDMGAVSRNGLQRSQSVEQRKQVIATAAAQRWVEASGGETEYTGGTPHVLTNETDPVSREFYDFYRTSRGEFTPAGSAPNLTTHPTLSSQTKFMNFYPFSDLDTISPRPVMFISGDMAHSREFSEDAYEAAAEPKELVWIPGAGHVDLYDRVDLIPFGRLTEFFQQNLSE